MVKEHEGWKTYYYDMPVQDFGTNTREYQTLIGWEKVVLPNLLDSESPKTFVLGGFHPFNGTPDKFTKFCDELHRHPKNRHIYLDMNRTALQGINHETHELLVQARLEELPLPDTSVDFLFLDYTIDFMNDEQMLGFSSSAARALKQNGLLLITKTYHDALQTLSINKPLPGITLHPRDIAAVLQLLPAFKTVGALVHYHKSTLALARKDSELPIMKLSHDSLHEVYPDPK